MDEKETIMWITDNEDGEHCVIEPIVYTTKLDDMHTINSDLSGLNSKEIVELLLEESKPKSSINNVKNRQKRCLESYTRLVSVVKQLNYKARLNVHNSKVRNLKLLNHCRPFSIVLEDLKMSKPKNKTNAIRNMLSNIPKTLSLVSSSKKALTVQVKIEAIDNETLEPEIPRVQIASYASYLDMSDQKAYDPLAITENNVMSKNTSNNLQLIKLLQTKKSIAPQFKESVVVNSSYATEPLHENTTLVSASKTISKARHNNAEAIPPLAKKAKTKEPVQRIEPDSSDEDDNQYLKRKPAKTFPKLSQDKYSHIVLTKKCEEAYFYRVSPTKLVTHYYVRKEFDDYHMAAIYPKEDKIVEIYCCWFKKEEIITKLCSRKNFPVTLQKFLRQTHPCIAGDCRCCCKTNIQSHKATEKQSIAAYKSLAAADDWIRGLLSRNKSTYVGVVNKAMNYFPIVQFKEKVTVKKSENYSEFFLLCIKYVGILNNTFKAVTELYVIGNNGNVVRSYLFDRPDKDQSIRMTYSLMGIRTKQKTFCCWYAREKLMVQLREEKISPSTLKFIQMSHGCKINRCVCCCKLVTKPSSAYGVLPSILKYTTAYEKNTKPLVIRFKITAIEKTKQPSSSILTNVNTYCTDNKNTQNVIDKIPSQSDINDDDDIAEIPTAESHKTSIPIVAPRSSVSLLKVPVQRKNEKMAATFTSKINCTKTNYPCLKSKSTVALNMYSSLANLMETKNKNQLESFKSFFIDLVLPELPGVQEQNIPKSSSDISVEQVSSIKIVETYSLASSSKESSAISIVDPSRVTLSGENSRTESSENVRIYSKRNPSLSIASNTEMETNNNALKRKAKSKTFDYTRVDKMIRVKSPSELMAVNTSEKPETPASSNSENPHQTWPAPIVIKREPLFNTIVNPAESIAYQINPNPENQSYLVPIGDNNVAFNSFYQLSGNLQAPVNSPKSITVKKGGLRILTLTPISAPLSNTVDNNTELGPILRNEQIDPVSPDGHYLPPLVHIKRNTAPEPNPATEAVKYSGISSSSFNNIDNLPVTIKEECNYFGS